MIERRKYKRTKFKFFILEHRPENSSYSQATRVLKCLDFSAGGICVEGLSLYDKFEITFIIPLETFKYKVNVSKKYETPTYFGLEFKDPDREMVKKILEWD